MNLMTNDVNDWKQSIIINDDLIGGKLRDDDRMWGSKGGEWDKGGCQKLRVETIGYIQK